ncbi:hypothetical protein LTR28_009115 [Elasticomyces elasticus]|nr:hypothetical protein LTR28_009115 [Elasticomyces elasticus]
MTTANRPPGLSLSRLVKMPRLAETRAKGASILSRSSALWEKGSKMGMSREKEETEAMLPVLKKADWRR